MKKDEHYYGSVVRGACDSYTLASGNCDGSRIGGNVVGGSWNRDRERGRAR